MSSRSRSPLPYPTGCDVVFGEYYVPYYPDELKASYCLDFGGWAPYW